MKKIQGGFIGRNVSVEYGPYGEYREFPFYDMKGLSVDEIRYDLADYDDTSLGAGNDGEYYMILELRYDYNDKIAVDADQYDEYQSAVESEDYDYIID